MQSQVTGGSGIRGAAVTLSRFLPVTGCGHTTTMTPVDTDVAGARWAPLTCHYLQSISLSDEVCVIRHLSFFVPYILICLACMHFWCSGATRALSETLNMCMALKDVFLKRRHYQLLAGASLCAWPPSLHLDDVVSVAVHLRSCGLSVHACRRDTSRSGAEQSARVHPTATCSWRSLPSCCTPRPVQMLQIQNWLSPKEASSNKKLPRKHTKRKR